MGGAAGGAEALIVDRCAHDQEVAAGETSHPALITYTNLIDSDHMGNLSPPTPGHWRYPIYIQHNKNELQEKLKVFHLICLRIIEY